MFVLFSLYYFSAPGAQGLPVTISTAEAHEESSCNDLHNCAFEYRVTTRWPIEIRGGLAY